MRRFLYGAAALALICSPLAADPGHGGGHGGGGHGGGPPGGGPPGGGGGDGGGHGHGHGGGGGGGPVFAGPPGGGGGGHGHGHGGGGPAFGGPGGLGGGGHGHHGGGGFGGPVFAGGHGRGGGHGHGHGGGGPVLAGGHGRGGGHGHGGGGPGHAFAHGGGPRGHGHGFAPTGAGRHGHEQRFAGGGAGHGSHGRFETGGRGVASERFGYAGAASHGRLAQPGFGSAARFGPSREEGRGPGWALAGGGHRGWIDGCPPGLAKKDNGCNPPGQLRSASVPYWRPDWYGLDGWADRDWLYDDGYMLRLSGERVIGYIPLLGGALAIGDVWPLPYEPVALPDYYVDYYDLGPTDDWRYYDDAIYRVDPRTSTITAVAALLTGDPFVVGQPLPDGYDVYNVPIAYRAQYIDGPDAWYRYSDGYIYRVDPVTRLIQAAIQLLT
ncbi:MAG: hypothetical protein JF593_00530 [Novosphingobium sp.]|nr:hypothetical protein [Novosphingobium sp.]